MKTVLVTGSDGFIGRHLVDHLAQAGWRVMGVVRRGSGSPALSAIWPDLKSAGEALQKNRVDVVVHCAGLAHADAQAADAPALTAVNVDHTLDLYHQSIAAGVGCFIWLSSIKVLGDVSAHSLGLGSPYSPNGPYARSKMVAEQRLLGINASGTSLHIVRLPLVYGVGVKANFLALLGAAAGPWPLPLKSASAPRAWLGVDNLCAFLAALAVSPPEAVPLIWHVRDREQSSVAQMVQQIRTVLGRSPQLWSFPPALALALASVAGRKTTMQRLFLPMSVDMSETQRRLGWQPPITQYEQLEKTAAWFRTF
ncbi:MAG: NAD-dependent epimerase/dehydratase family protein [Gammaproteobacteria bacterium]|nr:NAD-dependent epimerase/dehydratase family protein [Gammaproteobacteria bacterium]